LPPKPLENGGFRFFRDSGSPDNPAVISDISAEGALLRRRIFPPVYKDDFPVVLDGPAGEVVLRREPESGKRQLFWAEGDALQPKYRQLTFLRAEHSAPQLSADGRTIFYLAPDPRSGFTQLFRRTLPSQSP
jgi:hypothetical protein